jgi:hypothetical protein
MATRLSDDLEGRNMICMEQSGFRTSEEAIAQAVALYEAVGRRKHNKQDTFLCFVDFRKAYDLVPHEALMRKVEAAGVGGTFLSLIKSLYDNSSMTVRVGDDLSDPYTLGRGLRQGCPLSPMLFNVFINDILDDCKLYGASIPGINESRRLAGLLFADDLVLVANSVHFLREILKRVSRWADNWGMQLGHGKCKLMSVFANGEALTPEARIKCFSDSGPWIFQGHEIGVCHSYTYLGVTLNDVWSLDAFVDQKIESVRKSIESIRHVLSNRSIPQGIRLMAFRALVVGVLNYGGELLGMDVDNARKVQTVLNAGLRLCTNMSKSSSVAAIMRETMIPPASAVWAGSRSRAYVKWKFSRCWVGLLIENPPHSRKRSWVNTSRSWLLRHGMLDKQSARPLYNWDKMRDQVLSCEWKNFDARVGAKTLSFQSYLRWNLLNTAGYFRYAVEQGLPSQGVTALTNLRLLNASNARKLRFLGLVPEDLFGKCLCCKKGVGHTGEAEAHHILFECAAFSDIRAQHSESIGLDKIMALGLPWQRLRAALGGGHWVAPISKRLSLWDSWLVPMTKYLAELWPRKTSLEFRSCDARGADVRSLTGSEVEEYTQSQGSNTSRTGVDVASNFLDDEE